MNVGNGQTIGGVGGSWTVTSGDVDLEGSWADSPLGGTALGLDGTVPGAIEQTISTVAGRQYQVVFALTGNFQGGNTQDELRVSAAGISEDFSVTMPSGWSTGNLLWEHRSFTFTADDINTVLEFASLSPSGGLGPVISDVQVIEIPQAVSTILNNDRDAVLRCGDGEVLSGNWFNPGIRSDGPDHASAMVNDTLLNWRPWPVGHHRFAI